MTFLAQRLHQRGQQSQAFAIFGSEVPFPFVTTSSDKTIDGVEAGINQCAQNLLAMGIESRLTSKQAYTGCFNGYVTELAEHWINAHESIRGEVAVYACGPTPMLRAVADFAARHALPCQVSLEEYMACAVGGCAGCTVMTRRNGHDSMQRVCVDGPVFDARDVFFD